MIDCDDSLAGVLAEPDLEPSAGVDAHVTRSTGSLQQRLADVALEAAQLLGDRRRGVAEPLRRRRDRAALHDGLQHPEPGQIPHGPLTIRSVSGNAA